MLSLIETNRRAIEKDLARSSKRWYFSPENYSQYRCTLPMVEKHARGQVIDLGCGEMALQSVIQSLGLEYDSLDLIPSSEQVTFEANIQDMSMISDQSYDTAICLQVLEHVPDPHKAVHEIFRILKTGGQLILSVPHLSRIHEEPNDFQRFTEYGIHVLLEEAGFHIEEILTRGGLFSFLGHQVSSITIPLVWRVPLLKDLVFAINSILITHACFYFDQLLTPSRHYFPLGYTVMATKPGELA